MSAHGKHLLAIAAGLRTKENPAAVAGLENNQYRRRKSFGKSSAAAAVSILCAATTVQAAVGDQIIVRDLIASKGWTAVVPMNLNGDRLTDLLSYNAKTGRAVYSTGSNEPGSR